jgi:hypothetical protein
MARGFFPMVDQEKESRLLVLPKSSAKNFAASFNFISQLVFSHGMTS